MLVFACGHTALASPSHHESEIAYARAETLRHRVLNKPLSARTRADFERALDAYRTVYHTDPASPDAARSIAAVADLLAEEGRCLHDAKLSHDAIAQWEFLRREYPGSALRERALFQEAQIAQHDLHDRAGARKIYRNFLMRYPRDPLAEQVRAEMGNNRRDEQVSAEMIAELHANAAIVAAPREHAGSGKHPLKPARVSIVSKESSSSTTNVSVAHVPFSVIHSATLQDVRYWTEGNATRLVVDMNEPIPYHAYTTPDGKQVTLIFFGAHASEHLIGNPISVRNDANLRSVRASALTADQTELILQLQHAETYSSFSLSNPDRLILDIRPVGQDNVAPKPQFRKTRAIASTLSTTQAGITTRPTHLPVAAEIKPTPPETFTAKPATLAQQTSDTQHSMARVLGLRIRRIVIDAGHGGHDSGTLGPGGLEEKDVALDVALRLGHLLRQRLGAEVIYTRRTDKFVPLEERTAIANRAHADLFLSIHANSSTDPDVRGVETYFLNFTASPDALQVAARENAISNRSVHELSDLVRTIALSDKIDESREFAADVQQSLYSGLSAGNDGLKNRGVKQAPFVVLIGANMPSILAEISFLTNPEDASELTQPAYRERLAESLYQGVAQYVEGMSGVRIAKTAPLDAPQAPAE